MLFGLWPTCARKDCGAPAFVKFEFTEGEQIIQAWLCITCMGDAPELFCEASKARAEETKSLNGQEGDKIPSEERDRLPDGP